MVAIGPGEEKDYVCAGSLDYIYNDEKERNVLMKRRQMKPIVLS